MSATEKPARPERGWLLAGFFCLTVYAAALWFRPIMPIDETRYLSVAWEMWLRHDWLAPLTVNFQPYHHKPPLLFWSINLMWSIFGVNRWSALIPLVAAAFGSVMLMGALCERLAPELKLRAQVVMLGSLAFLVYASLILFDLTMTVFVLGALLCLFRFASAYRMRYMILMGVLLGMGVLTKGPVAYLYVLFPILLAPYWLEDTGQLRRWYAGNLLALLVSLVPVALWLVPVLQASNGDFAYWLLWEQTAGRVSGSFAASHDRPAWFYLVVLPVLLVPWVLFGAFWRGLGKLRHDVAGDPAMRFLAAWLVPTLLAFSLIGGKQPHYLVPLLPGFAILVAGFLANVRIAVLRRSAVGMLAVLVAVFAVGAPSVKDKYDLQPLADFVDEHRDEPIAFAGGHYRGEFTYLARLDRTVDTPALRDLDAWFVDHPGGFAVVRYESADELSGYRLIYSQPYRGRQIGVATVDAGKSLALSRPVAAGPTHD